MGNWGVAQSVKHVLALRLARIPVTRHARAKISAAVCHPATGYMCYRDGAGNPKCRDPNPPPPPDPTTIVQTQVVTETYQPPSHATTSQAVQTGAVLGSETKKSVGAIVGGVVAGVIAVVVLVLGFIFWRRRQTSETPATGTQPNYPPAPPNTNQYNIAGAVPPTPNSGDPFLTPMGQHQNLGVSYPNGTPAPGTPPSGSNSGTGPYDASHYSGLPEPQQNEMDGSAMPLSTPRSDLTHPHLLPMSIVHSQQPQPQPQTSDARPWSGYAQSSGVSPAPYVESNNSQPGGWTAPANNGWTNPPPQTQVYATPLYAGQSDTGAGRPPSTAPRSPPMSPPLPDVYGGMAAGGSEGGGMPVGVAPRVDV
ncbi:hypothetical protein FRC10_002782 [Ceratobasidium sp. 414]|nr:hypothetical protein FRC10_002782 [Ceratobasidium sp. 414]